MAISNAFGGDYIWSTAMDPRENGRSVITDLALNRIQAQAEAQRQLQDDQLRAQLLMGDRDRQAAAARDQLNFAGTNRGYDVQLELGRLQNEAQRQGLGNDLTIAQLRDATERRGQDYQNTQFGSAQDTARRGQDVALQQTQIGDATNRRGQDLDFAAFNQGDATARRAQDFSLQQFMQGDATARLGQQRDLSIASMGNATQQRGQDLSRETAAEANTTAQRGQDVALQQARLNADVTSRGQDLQLQAANIPYEYRREVMGQVFPLVQQAFAGLGGAGGQQQAGLVGGQNTPLPALPPSEVYSPQRIQEQVNAAQAGNAASADSRRRQLADEASGRGFGRNSPLLMALQGQIDQSTRASDADAERQLRFDAATANAQQGLGVGNLAQQQWRDFNQADIQRRQANNLFQQNQFQNQAALIAALAGFA